MKSRMQVAHRKEGFLQESSWYVFISAVLGEALFWETDRHVPYYIYI